MLEDLFCVDEIVLMVRYLRVVNNSDSLAPCIVNSRLAELCPVDRAAEALGDATPVPPTHAVIQEFQIHGWSVKEAGDSHDLRATMGEILDSA